MFRANLTSFAQGNVTENSLSFEPKLGLFFLNNRTADGSGLDNLSNCIGGVAGGTNSNNAVAAQMEHGQAGRSQTATYQNSNFCAAMVSFTGTLQMQAIATLDPAGYTFEMYTDDGVDRVISALMLGGAEITSHETGVLSVSGVGGIQSFTIGFKPDVVIFYGATEVANDPFAAPSFIGSFYGWMCADGSQGVTSIYCPGGVFNPQTARYQRTTACISFILTAGQICEGSFVSMDTNGFTVDFPIVDLDLAKIYFVAIKGGNWHAGSFNTKTSTGSQSTTVGFQPDGIILTTNSGPASTSVVSHALQTIGCGVSSLQQAMHFTGSRNQNDSYCYSGLDRTLILETYRIAFGLFVSSDKANLVSLDLNGFTLNYSAAGSISKQVLYLAFGPKSTVHIKGGHIRGGHIR